MLVKYLNDNIGDEVTANILMGFIKNEMVNIKSQMNIMYKLMDDLESSESLEKSQLLAGYLKCFSDNMKKSVDRITE